MLKSASGYPHGLCRVDRRAAADGDDPVRLELAHGFCAAHDGFDGRIGFNAFEELNLHAGLAQISFYAIEKTKALHGAAANDDERPFASEGFERFQRAFSVIKIAGECKT